MICCKYAPLTLHNFILKKSIWKIPPPSLLQQHTCQQTVTHITDITNKIVNRPLERDAPILRWHWQHYINHTNKPGISLRPTFSVLLLLLQVSGANLINDLMGHK